MHDQPNATDIRRRTQHGLPLTQEQQRYAVQIAFGPLPPRRKRMTCTACDGNGRLNKNGFWWPCTCTDGEIWVDVPDEYTIEGRQCLCGKVISNRCPECEIGDALP